MHELLATGHGYMAWLPRVLGVAFAIEAIALLNLAVDGARGRRARPVPAWMFVALPALGFTIQEFFERALTTDTFPWWMVQQPTFRIGLVLQLPVGLAVYAVARLLLRAARAIGVAWARGRRLRLARVRGSAVAAFGVRRSPARCSCLRLGSARPSRSFRLI